MESNRKADHIEADYIIEITGVYAGYEGQGILKDVSLSVEAGEFVVIIGPSGCGKTTLLKTVNGLVVPDRGEVLVEGENLRTCDLIRLRRRIGYVVQGARLFPHMTIADNICFVPGISGKMNPQDKRSLVEELLELVQLPAQIAGRFPAQLSGGQQQRVGIARALASRPKILLMDEPFGAVDGITRKGLQAQLLALQKKMGVTVVFITHDIAEAVKLGSRIVVMQEGRIIQEGSPEQLKEHPGTEFVRQLFDEVQV